jgi:YrbI family 3-deoxy-D-manno-octulosonate 8-phosphate phosphatase
MTPSDDQKETIRRLQLVAFDFDGVFTDNGVWISEDGKESVRCSRLDGLGLSALRRIGIHLLVVSTETNPVVRERCRKLQIDCVQGCRDKDEAVRRRATEIGAPLEETAFVGNDINDLPVLEIVGLPVVVADAYPSAVKPGYLRTTRPGGHGAVREFCELVVAVREEALSHG